MAQLLVDEGIGRNLVQDLVVQGNAAFHAIDLGLKGMHDARIFLEAQQRKLTIFTRNREDFVFAATCWTAWGLGPHHGIIAPRAGTMPTPAEIAAEMLRFCADSSSFIDRIALF
jgi:predicted nuclease of predicted toxin-antitoxin system